jgi:hypothetical protein
MRRILGYTGIAFLLSTGIAVAGPHGGGGGRGGGGVVVRDHRSAPVVTHGGYGGGGGGMVVRDHRSYGGGYAGGGAVVRDHRGPVRVTGGRYMFPGGVVRTYRAPVIREHYYSYYRRPAILVENYEPVPGYYWVRGNWSWNGAEWMWVPGYWQAGGGAGLSVGASVVVD